MLGTKVIIPFLNNRYLDLGPLYVPFIAFGSRYSKFCKSNRWFRWFSSGVTLIVLLFWISGTNWGFGSISVFSAALTELVWIFNI